MTTTDSSRNWNGNWHGCCRRLVPYVTPSYRWRSQVLLAAGRVRSLAGACQAPMAASQAHVVHEGVLYDLEVDTTDTESLVCARAIAAQVG